MDLHRRTSLIAGIFFACTFIFSIPALLFYDPLLNHVDYIVGAGADTRVAFGALFEIIVVISNIATAIVLFPILKRQNEAVSLGYVASRIVESTIIAVGIIRSSAREMVMNSRGKPPAAQIPRFTASETARK